MSNAANTPTPVHTHVETDFYWLDRLPKGVRTYLVERTYDYDSKMAYDMYRAILETEYYPTFAVGMTNQQLLMNDVNITKKEMAEKWKSSGFSIPSNSSLPNSLMRPIGRIATRSATIRNRLGTIRRNGKKSRLPMEFSLFGTILPSPPSSLTRDGSA